MSKEFGNPLVNTCSTCNRKGVPVEWSGLAWECEPCYYAKENKIKELEAIIRIQELHISTLQDQLESVLEREWKLRMQIAKITVESSAPH